MTFTFIHTTDTLTPSHYKEFESQAQSRTPKRRSYDIGTKDSALAREAYKQAAVKPCGCTYNECCENCSYS